MLRSLWRGDQAIRFKPRLSVRQLAWVARFLGQCNATSAKVNTASKSRFCVYSQAMLDEVVAETGVSFDERRGGLVRRAWDALRGVSCGAAGSSAGGSGPADGDFPPGGRRTGSVTTRAGRRLAGRLVYDLDESEITETLDAPSQGVNYTIPFGLIASLVPLDPEERGAQHARVTLHSGEELQLERTGDLGDRNAGMLIFVKGRERPEYVPWTDVEQVDFDRPPVMYPPVGGR